MCTPIQRFILAFVLILCTSVLYAQDSLQSERRLNVKVEVSTHDGNPYHGSILLRTSLGDKVRLYTNRFGLGFVQLLPNEKYYLSLEGFPNFASLQTESLHVSDQEVELTLPPFALRDATAKEGFGLVRFEYVDRKGEPLQNKILYCKSEDGMLFTGITDRIGRVRVEVPLGHTYVFSVDGFPDFDTHTFTKYPPLQTADIKLELGKREEKRATGLHIKREKPVDPVDSKRQYRTRSDSLQGARKRILPPRAQRIPSTFAIPARTAAARSSKVTKQVLEGIYMLRTVVQNEEKQNRNFLRTSRLTLLRRLRELTYDSAVFVVDVTCSMDLFVEEYLLWLSMVNNSPKIYGGVFFNDGDGKADSLKVLGATGGLHKTTNRIDEEVRSMVEAISYGCSGEEAENDLEALLYAQREFPSAKMLVLVADNSSPVRDIELLDALTIPVHVILCSTEPIGAANPPHDDYVNIALATKGSISTLAENLKIIRDGMDMEQIVVGRWRYKKLKDRFVRNSHNGNRAQ